VLDVVSPPSLRTQLDHTASRHHGESSTHDLEFLMSKHPAERYIISMRLTEELVTVVRFEDVSQRDNKFKICQGCASGCRAETSGHGAAPTRPKQLEDVRWT